MAQSALLAQRSDRASPRARNAPGWAAWVALGYGCVASRSLIDAWRSSPFDRWGWACFAIWLLPAICEIGGHFGEIEKLPRRQRPLLLAAGLACSFLGTIAALHILAYWGLAFSVGCFFVESAADALALALAASWMPFLGWIFSALGPAAVAALRVALAIVGAALFLARRN